MLSWGSRPPELTPPRFGVRSLAATHAGGVSPIHARLRAPSRRGCIPRPGLRRLSSRAQDPSTHEVYRTSSVTVRRRPSSRSASRALPCASHQHRPAPCRARSNGASCPCPLSAAPRASLPFTVGSLARGRRPLDLEDALSSNRRPDPTPRGAGWRPNPSRSSVWSLLRQLSPASESTPGPLTFVTGPSSVDPPLREERIGGGPPCRQVGRLSWDFVPRRPGSMVRAEEPVLAYPSFGFPTDVSPRARHPVTGTPSHPNPP